MAEPTLIDLAALLAPIREDAPAGADLNRSPLFDKINELRTTDDPGGAVDESVGKLRDGQARVADFPKVIALCTEALTNKTKDLTLVAYLTEALARVHGLAGIHDGILLLHGMHERWWEEMYPRAADNDLEPRAMWLERFDRLVQKTLADLELTVRVDGETHAFWEWQNAQHKGEKASQASADTRDGLMAEAQELRAALEKAVEKTPRKFYQDLVAAGEGCQQALEEVRNLVDEKFRSAPGVENLEDPIPNFGALRQGLQEVQYKIEDLLRTKPAPAGSAMRTAAATELTDSGGAPASFGGPAGAPGSRAEALRRLQEVAEFFARTEPHSPVSYLVQRAARWGELSLDRWLEEVVSDSSTLAHIRETLGIRPESSSE